MPQPISIQNARIIDNFYLWEAFQGINNGRVYSDFRISDNFYLYQVILAGVGGSAMDIKGSIDCSTNPNYPAAGAGDVYRVSVAGRIGGAAGLPVNVGDLLICFVASAAGTQAGVGANWTSHLAVNRDTNGTVVGKGQGATAATNTLYLVNSAGDITMRVRNDFQITAGDPTNTNLFMGIDCGTSNTPAGVDGTTNTGFGYQALKEQRLGETNTAFGFRALRDNQNADGNSAFGGQALLACAGNYNSAFGDHAGESVSTGVNNVLFGFGAGKIIGAGGYNVVVGANSFVLGNNASDNTVLGAAAGVASVTGQLNVFIGSSCANKVTGNTNTIIGAEAGFNVTGAGSVYLGYGSGYYETGSNKLFIDNAKRASEADARTKALIYGIFDAATANQFLTINGHALIREDLQFTTKTIDTTAGDAATINSPAGRFRKDTTGTTFTLTNSYITANSIILLQWCDDPGAGSAHDVSVIAGVGSCVITFGAAPSGNADMNFLVIN